MRQITLLKEDVRVSDKLNAECITVECAIIVVDLRMECVVVIILVFMNVCKIVAAAEVF